MFRNWEFKFKNLGPVRDATLRLGDLTIITGRNNTGKTYMVYTLYGFLRDFSELVEEVMDKWKEAGSFSYGIPVPVGSVAQTLLENGNFEVGYSKEDFDEDRTQLMGQMCRLYSHDKIDFVFNAGPGTFSGAVFNVIEDRRGREFPPVGIAIETQIGGDLSIFYSEDRLFFVYERDKVRQTQARADELIQRFLLEGHIRQAYARFLFQDTQDFLWPPKCSTSVRLATSLFHSELENKRRFTVRQLQQLGDEQDLSPAEFLRRYTSRYALPIDDEIDFVKSIPDFSSGWLSSGKGGAEKELEEIVGGRFTKSDGVLYFIPSEGNPQGKKIPLYLSSSSATEMSRLFFHFVLNREEQSRLLIIDEPESHLDTMNQIQLARALVRWVNSGMKILISTHSDYIVKEINNLIMLNGSFDNKEELLGELGYSEGDSIDPTLIEAYYAKDGGLEACHMNAFGIEVPSFENSIDELVRVSSVLGSRIMLGGGERE